MVTDRRVVRDPSVLSAAEVIERLSAGVVRDTGVDGLSVALVGVDGPSVSVHATDEVSAEMGEIEFTLGEGPGPDTYRTGTPVLADNLLRADGEAGGHWPLFRAEAWRLGVHALFAFPIRMGAVTLGTVDLLRSSPGALDDRQLERALTAVDAIGRSLLGLGAEGDEGAYPMPVQQAAGMAKVQLGCSITEALVRLRAAAYAEGVPLGRLAADIVAGRRRMQREEA